MYKYDPSNTRKHSQINISVDSTWNLQWEGEITRDAPVLVGGNRERVCIVCQDWKVHSPKQKIKFSDEIKLLRGNLLYEIAVYFTKLIVLKQISKLEIYVVVYHML